MMLVDTSVWIELLNGKVGSKLTEADLLDIVTCGPILQEVLQGLSDDPASEALRESLLALPVLSNPVPIALFLSAAEIYRLGRAKGYTIRSSTDCLIAAIAIENGVPVWHKDRDFEAVARYTSLRTRRMNWASS
jgi:predicted nucleic acid-binding protein